MPKSSSGKAQGAGARQGDAKPPAPVTTNKRKQPQDKPSRRYVGALDDYSADGSGETPEEQQDRKRQERERLEKTIPANVKSIRKVNREVREEYFGDKDVEIHLRDIVWTAHCSLDREGVMAGYRRDGWYGLCDFLSDRWEGKFDADQLGVYATALFIRRSCACLPERSLPAREFSPSTANKPDWSWKIDANLQRLHDDGLTRKALVWFCGKYPKAAEISLLSKGLRIQGEKEAAGPEDEEKPGGNGLGGTDQKDDIKRRFDFAPGQALFDGEDLGLPTWLCTDVLKKLVDSFGRTVPHEDLHEQSRRSEASVELRQAVKVIKMVLKSKDVPCQIQNKRGEGYVLR